MVQFSLIKSSEAVYEERKRIVFLDSEISQKGRLAYIAPNHVIRELLSPVKEKFEANDDLLTVDRKNKRQQISLKSAPAIAAFIESFRGTLSGNLELLRRYYTVGYSGTLESWKLLLVPTQKEMKRHVSKVVIQGKSTDIGVVEVHEQNGDWSRLVLTTVSRKLREH